MGTDCSPAKETAVNVLSLGFLGNHVIKSCFEVTHGLLEIFFDEFVLRSRIVSPLIEPLLKPGGWQEE